MTSPLFSKSPKAEVIVALISIALAAGWLRAQAQTTSGAVISGTVSIDHGRVAAFRVKAKDTMRRIAYTVYTHKGRYNIYNLPAGHYEISVLEEGIEPVTQTVDLPAGKTVNGNLNLRATTAAEERIGISGARAQENYGGVRGTAKATARIVDFDTLYPPGRGRDLIQLYCLGCHGPGGFHQRGFGNEATWRARVDKMFTRKSGILTDEPMIGTGVMSEEDKSTIIKYLADNFGPNSESRDLAPDPIVRDEDALSRTIFVQYELPSPDEARTQGLGRAQRTTHDTFPSLITPGVVWVAGLGTNSILRVNTSNLDPAERNKEYFVKDPRNIMLGVHGVIEVPGRVHWTELMGDHLGELDTNTGDIRRYAQPTKGGGHTPRADSKGNVWFTEVSGNGKIGRWDAQTKQITEYDPVKGANYYGVVVDKKDRVFVAGMTKKTLVMWDPKTQAWSNLNPPSNVRRLALDSKDNVWACAYGNNSIIRADANTLQMEEYRLPLKNGNPYAIYVDKEDNVWVENAVYNSFVMFDPRTKKFTYFPFPELNAHTPNMEMDSEGTIWFGIGEPSRLTGLKLRGNVAQPNVASR